MRVSGGLLVSLPLWLLVGLCFFSPLVAGQSDAPSAVPTASPSAVPTASPTINPTTETPTARPSATPSQSPSTTDPTGTPTAGPTFTPSGTPSAQPTAQPSASPSATPSAAPSTATPTTVPTTNPTAQPTAGPTAGPTEIPTAGPTAIPTVVPSAAPTGVPTAGPTAVPTTLPTVGPTAVPTGRPTAAPTTSPTRVPTAAPTITPTAGPTAVPTGRPTAAPSAGPSAAPTATPTAAPTATPTSAPSCFPGSFAPVIGSGVCEACVGSALAAGGNFTADPFTPCQACAGCGPGFEVTTPCTPTQDRGCAGCGLGTFALAADVSCTSCVGSTAATGGNFTLDSTMPCQACRACGAGFEVGTPCTPASNRGCVGCLPGSFALAADVTCTRCVGSNRAAGGAFTLRPNESCTACAGCGPGFEVTTPCTPTQDRGCAGCGVGTFALAADVSCTSCVGSTAATGGNFTLDSTMPCQACQACGAGFGVLINCTGAEDRQCFGLPTAAIMAASTDPAAPFVATVGTVLTYRVAFEVPAVAVASVVATITLPLVGGAPGLVPNASSALWVDVFAATLGGNVAADAVGLADPGNGTLAVTLTNLRRLVPGVSGGSSSLTLDFVGVVPDLVGVVDGGALGLIVEVAYSTGAVAPAVATTIPVGEPTVVITRAGHSTASHDAGDAVAFGLTLAQPVGTTTPAFNLTLISSMGTAYDVALPSVVCIPGPCAPGDPSWDPVSGVLTLRIAELASGPGGAVAVQWVGIVRTDVHPGQTLPDDTLGLSYQSSPELAGGARRYTATDPAGANRGVVPLATLSLGLAQSSIPWTAEAGPAGPQVTVHEQMDFSLAVALPEGTSNLSVSLTVPGAGAAAVVEAIAVSLVQFGASLQQPGGNGLAAPTPVVAGRSVVLDFGTVENSPDNVVTAGDVVTFRLSWTLSDTPAVINNSAVTTTAAAELSDGRSVGPVSTVATCVFPDLSVVLSLDAFGGGQPDAGDVVVARVELDSFSGTAYDVTVIQHLPLGLDLAPGTATCAVGCPGDFAVVPGPANDSVVLTFSELAVGIRVEVTWDLVLGPALSVHPNAVLTSIAETAFDTSPADSGFPGRRLAAPNTSSAVTVRPPAVTLRADSSSIVETVLPSISPTEVVGCTVEVTIPEGQMTNGLLTVAFAASLTPINLTVVSVPAGLALDPITTTVGTGFTFQFGQPTANNTASSVGNETVVFESYAELTFNPVGFYATPTLSARLTADNDVNISDVTTLTVVEPRLRIADTSAGGYLGDAGDTIQYGLVVGHVGSDAAAFQVELNYTMTPRMVFTGVAACVASTGAAINMSDVAGSCITANSTAAPAALSPSFVDLIHVSAPLVLLGEALFVSVTVRLTDAIDPAVDELNVVTVRWSSSGTTTIAEQYVTSVLQRTNVVQPTIASALTASADNSSIDVAVGEVFSADVTIFLPEGTTNLSFTINDSAFESLDLVAAEAASVGNNIGGVVTGAPLSSLSAGSAIIFDLGVLTNVADNFVNVSDFLILNLTLRLRNVPLLVGIGNISDRTQVIIQSDCLTTGTVAAESNFSTLVADSNLVLSLQNTSGPVGTGCRGTADASDGLSFGATFSHSDISRMNAYNVVLTCNASEGLVIVNSSIIVDITGGADPTSLAFAPPIVGATTLVVNWPTWSIDADLAAPKIARVSFEANVSDTILSGQFLSVVCSLESQSVPVTVDGNGSIGRFHTADAANPASRGPEVNISFFTVAQKMSASLAPQLASPFGFATIGENLSISIDVLVPEGTSNVAVNVTFPTAVQFVTAFVDSIGTSVNNASLVADDRLNPSAHSVHFNFGQVTNVANNVIDSNDNLSVTVIVRLNNTESLGAPQPLTVDVASVTGVDCPTERQSLDVVVAEPDTAVGSAMSVLDLPQVFLDAGDPFQCAFNIFLTSSVLGVNAYNVTVIGRPGGDFLTVDSAPNGTVVNGTEAIWEFAELVAGESPQITFVQTLTSDVPIGYDSVRCFFEASYSTVPVDGGRVYHKEATSPNPLVVSSPVISAAVTFSDSQTTILPQVSLGETYTTTFTISIPSGVVTLALAVGPVGPADRTAVSGVSVSIGSDVNCSIGESGLGSLLNGSFEIDFGVCQAVVGTSAHTIQVFVNSSVIDSTLDRIDGDVFELRGQLNFSTNVTGVDTVFASAAVELGIPSLDFAFAPVNPGPLSSGSPLPFNFSLRHTTTSSAAAHDVTVRVTFDPRLGSVLATSQLPLASVVASSVPQLLSWTIPLLPNSSAAIFFNASSTVSVAADLGSVLNESSVFLSYATMPSVSPNRRVTNATFGIPSTSIVSTTSMTSQIVNTSEIFTPNTQLTVGESVFILSEVKIPSSTNITLSILVPGLSAGLFAVARVNVAAASGVSCELSPVSSIFGDLVSVPLGRCENSLGHRNNTAISLTYNVQALNESANINGALVNVSSITEYVSTNNQALHVSESIFLSIEEPSISLNVSSPPRSTAFVQTPPAIVSFTFEANVTYGNDVSFVITFFPFVVFNSIVHTGSIVSSNTLFSNSTQTLSIYFGAVPPNQSIAFDVLTSPQEDAPTMTELGLDAVLSVSTTLSEENRTYIVAESTAGVFVVELNLTTTESTSLDDTSTTSLAIGEAISINGTICFRGGGLLTITAILPSNATGTPLLSFDGTLEILATGADIQITTAPLLSATSNNISLVLGVNNSNTLPNGGDDGCMVVSIDAHATGGSAGNRGNVTLSAQLIDFVVSAPTPIRILEPDVAASLQVSGTSLDRVEIGDNITFDLSVTNTGAADHSDVYEFSLNFSVEQLDPVTVAIVSDSCGGFATFNVANHIIFTKSHIPLGEACSVSFSAVVGGSLGPGEVVAHTANMTYVSVPAVLNTTDIRRPYAVIVAAPTYTAANLALQFAVINSTFAEHTGALDLAAIGAVLTLQTNVTIPHVSIAQLDVNFTYPPSSFLWQTPPVMSAINGSLPTPTTVIDPTPTGVQLIFSNLTSTPNNGIADLFVFTHDVVVADTLANEIAAQLRIETILTYDNDQNVTSGAVLTIVGPVLNQSLAVSSPVADAGDNLSITHCVSHSPDSASTAFNINVAILISIFNNFTGILPSSISLETSSGTVSAAVVNQSLVLIPNGTIFSSGFPILRRGETLCSEYAIVIRQAVTPRVHMVTSASTTAFSASIFGREIAVQNETATVLSANFGTIKTFTRSASALFETTSSVVVAIGGNYSSQFTLPLPEGTFPEMFVQFSAPTAQLSQSGCVSGIGSRVSGTGIVVNTCPSGVQTSGRTEHNFTFTDVVNVFDNVVNASDDVIFQFNGSLLDVSGNTNGVTVPILATATSGFASTTSQLSVIVGEPVLTASISAIDRVSSAGWLLEPSPAIEPPTVHNFTFSIDIHHQTTSLVSAHDLVVDVYVNGTAMNYSIVLLDVDGSPLTVFNDLPSNLLPQPIGSLVVGPLLLDASSVQTAQVQVPTSLNLQGDTVCLTIGTHYASLPASSPIRRQYSPSNFSGCFEAGAVFPARSTASAQTLSGGAIAGIIIALLALIVIAALLALRTQQRKESFGKSLAEIELSRMMSEKSGATKIRKTEEQLLKEKEEMKAKLIVTKVAAAEDTFRHAVAFSKLRYGRSVEITPGQLAIVYNMLNLSPKPRMEILPPLMSRLDKFLTQPAPSAVNLDDDFVDEIVEFIWRAIPDVMLESTIDAYAHLKEQLDQYFADLSAQRDADRAAAIAAAEAEGELPPVFEDEEDPYEIPARFLDSVSLYDGHDPIYAEIDDDANYIDPDEFGSLADDPDYEEMLEQLKKGAYIDVDDGPVHMFAVIEGDYGNYGDTYCNRVAETSFSSNPLVDDTYMNNRHAHEPDDNYGLESQHDPYTYAGDNGDDADRQSEASNDEIYSVANNLKDAIPDSDEEQGTENDVYGLTMRNVTLRRDDDEIYGLSDTEVDTTTPERQALRKKPCYDTKRKDKINDTYENSASVAHGADASDNSDEETYENRYATKQEPSLDRKATVGFDLIDAVTNAENSPTHDVSDTYGLNTSVDNLMVSVESTSPISGFPEAADDAVFSSEPLASPLPPPTPDQQVDAFRALLQAEPQGDIMYGSREDMPDVSVNHVECDTPNCPSHDTYASVHKRSDPPTLPARSLSVRTPRAAATLTDPTRSVDDLALTGQDSPSPDSKLFERRSSFAEDSTMLSKSPSGLQRAGSRTSMV